MLLVNTARSRNAMPPLAAARTQHNIGDGRMKCDAARASAYDFRAPELLSKRNYTRARIIAERASGRCLCPFVRSVGAPFRWSGGRHLSHVRSASIYWPIKLLKCVCGCDGMTGLPGSGRDVDSHAAGRRGPEIGHVRRNFLRLTPAAITCEALF